MNKLFFVFVVATAWLSSLYFEQVAGTYTSLTYYVNSIDKVYHWNVSDTVIRADNYTVYNIYLTSQVSNSIQQFYLQKINKKNIN